MRGRWLVVAAIALAVPAPAAAEDDAEVARVRDPKAALATARQAVKKGDAATRAKKADVAQARYAEAIAAFEDAIAAGADAGTYVELAAVEEKAGLLDRAAIHYRTVLAAQGVRAELVKKATARYDELTTKLGLVILAVTPAGATITLGGKVVGTTPIAEPLVLMPGSYAITIAADGHQPREIEIEVDAGSESERTIELEPVAPDTPRATPPSPPPTVARPAPRGPSTTPMLVAGGATIALLGLAAGTGVLAVGKHNQFEDPTSTPQEREDAKDSGKRLALITDLGLAGAAIAGGIAVYWYVAKYRPAQRAHAMERAPAEEVGAKVDLVPWVQSDAGGVTVLGSF